VLKRRDFGAIWLWMGGVLFMLWPFDLRVISVPLMPALLLLGAACTYFGFQPKRPKAKTEGLGADGSKSAREPGPADGPPAAAPAEESPSPK